MLHVSVNDEPSPHVLCGVQVVAADSQPPDCSHCQTVHCQTVLIGLCYCDAHSCITRSFARWGEGILDFVSCVAGHCIDRAFMSEKGWVNGEEMSPHPGYLGGRSPHYW